MKHERCDPVSSLIGLVFVGHILLLLILVLIFQEVSLNLTFIENHFIRK